MLAHGCLVAVVHCLLPCAKLHTSTISNTFPSEVMRSDSPSRASLRYSQMFADLMLSLSGIEALDGMDHMAKTCRVRHVSAHQGHST